MQRGFHGLAEVFWDLQVVFFYLVVSLPQFSKWKPSMLANCSNSPTFGVFRLACTEILNCLLKGVKLHNVVSRQTRAATRWPCAQAQGAWLPALFSVVLFSCCLFSLL